MAENTKKKTTTKKNSKKKDKAKKETNKKEEEKIEYKKADEKYEVFIKPNQGVISRILLEVYKTDEENFVPYEPNMGETIDEEKEDETDEETEEETEEEVEEEEEEDSDLKGFKLHQGEILETYYYAGFTDVSIESDYGEMTNNGSIKLPEVKDLNHFYKGVRLCVRKKWCDESENGVNLDDLPMVLLSFITDEKFAESGMSLTLSGMTKLLDKKYQFNFTQMKRSEILAEVIKTAGLIPMIDTTGLVDDVIDYTNISKEGDSDDGGSGADSNSADLNKLVKDAIKGKKGKREKAEAIHNALKDSCIKYRSYTNFQYNSVEECWEHRQNPGLNCGDTSQLTVGAMKIGGLKAETLLTFDSQHFITRIEGQWFSDLVWAEGACSQRPFDATWHNYRDGTPYSSPSG